MSGIASGFVPRGIICAWTQSFLIFWNGTTCQRVHSTVVFLCNRKKRHSLSISCSRLHILLAQPYLLHWRTGKTKHGMAIVWSFGWTVLVLGISSGLFAERVAVLLFGSGHPSNMSFALPGPEQTNQRAELAACRSVMECEPRQMEIRTDSKYVVDIARCWQREGDNYDLWRLFHEKLAARGEGNTISVKVKGHANK